MDIKLAYTVLLQYFVFVYNNCNDRVSC